MVCPSKFSCIGKSLISSKTEVLNAEIQPQFEDNLKAQGELYYHHELNGKVVCPSKFSCIGKNLILSKAEVLDTENKPEIDDNAQAEENEIKCYRINVLVGLLSIIVLRSSHCSSYADAVRWLLEIRRSSPR